MVQTSSMVGGKQGMNAECQGELLESSWLKIQLEMEDFINVYINLVRCEDVDWVELVKEQPGVGFYVCGGEFLGF